MLHSFNVEIAKNYGVESAIFLSHIAYWVMFNKNEDNNFYDDKYWTYNKIKSFPQHFPYWSHKQIERIINKCVKDGLLIRSSFNRLKYDRTCWYSLTELSCELLNLDISRNREMEIPKWYLPNPEIGTPIPNNKPDNKQQIKIKEKAQPQKKVAVLVDLPEWINKELWEEFKQFRKEIKKPMTELIQKKVISKLEKMRNQGQNVEDVLNQSIANGWQGIFEVKSTKERNYGNQQSEVKSAAQRFWERNTAGLPEYEKSCREREISSDTTDLCAAADFLF